MSHTKMWQETAVIHSPWPAWNPFTGSHLTEGHELDTPSCMKSSDFSPASPSKTIHCCNWRTFHKLHVLNRRLIKCSFRDASRGHGPVSWSPSKHKSWFYPCKLFPGLPPENSHRQSSKLTWFVSTLKLHSLMLSFAQRCAKNPLYQRTWPSPSSDEIYIALLMILVDLTLCKISSRRFWLNFRI